MEINYNKYIKEVERHYSKNYKKYHTIHHIQRLFDIYFRQNHTKAYLNPRSATMIFSVVSITSSMLELQQILVIENSTNL